MRDAIRNKQKKSERTLFGCGAFQNLQSNSEPSFFHEIQGVPCGVAWQERQALHNKIAQLLEMLADEKENVAERSRREPSQPLWIPVRPVS